jgi:hypothetical protein
VVALRDQGGILLPKSQSQRPNSRHFDSHRAGISQSPVSAPALHLTDGALNFGGPLHPVDIQGDTVSTQLPTQRPLTCHFSVTDERGLKVSTPHVELGK